MKLILTSILLAAALAAAPAFAGLKSFAAGALVGAALSSPPRAQASSQIVSGAQSVVCPNPTADGTGCRVAAPHGEVLLTNREFISYSAQIPLAGIREGEIARNFVDGQLRSTVLSYSYSKETAR